VYCFVEHCPFVPFLLAFVLSARVLRHLITLPLQTLLVLNFNEMIEKEQKDNVQQSNTQEATDLAQRTISEIWG
jgi:hypothetical protein